MSTTSSDNVTLTCTYGGASFDVPFTSEDISLTKTVARALRTDRSLADIAANSPRP